MPLRSCETRPGQALLTSVFPKGRVWKKRLGLIAVGVGDKVVIIIMMLMMMYMINIMSTMTVMMMFMRVIVSIDCLLSIGMVISSTALRCC